MIRVVLAQPRGFCAGVERAIEIVERALSMMLQSCISLAAIALLAARAVNIL